MISSKQDYKNYILADKEVHIPRNLRIRSKGTERYSA